jgi:hypothetical protein
LGRRAEEARRESERELRQNDRQRSRDDHRRPLVGPQEYANKRFLDFTGTTVEDVTGLDGLNLILVMNEWLRSSALGQGLGTAMVECVRTT